MRDHAVGTYGAAALALALLVKAAAIAALLGRPGAAAWLPGRGRALALGDRARRPLRAERAPDGLGASVAAHVGPLEVVGATVLALGIHDLADRDRGVAAWATVAVAGAALAEVCRRRVGGMTGDTLGATGELAEALVLVLGVGLTAP